MPFAIRAIAVPGLTDDIPRTTLFREPCGIGEHGMHILCVDDDRLVLAITADLIRAMGHEVIAAQNGCAAAKVIGEASPIDLLITDIGLPEGPSGFELARYARQLRPDLRIIFFSGAPALAADQQDAIVLRKPCTLRELSQAIAGTSH